MTASIQTISDFIYPASGQPGKLVFESKGWQGTPFGPQILSVAPGIYLCIMTGPATDWPRIEFKVGNAPVTFCLTLSGRFTSSFSLPGRGKETTQYIGPDTNCVGALNGAWGRMSIDPSLPISCVELLIDPCLFHRYLPDHLEDDGPKGHKPRLFNSRELISSPMDLQLRRTAMEIVNPPQLSGPALELFYQSRGMTLLARQVELLSRDTPCKADKPTLNPDIREQLIHAKSILIKDFMDPPTIPVLARRCGLNEFTLKKEFKKAFDTTIFTFVQNLRMEQAWALIKEKNHSVSEAANAVGYINVSHFSRAFKKQFSINPGFLKKHGAHTMVQ